MAENYSISGTLILKDEFSKALEKLRQGTSDAEKVLAKLGETTDEQAVKVQQRLNELTASTEKAKQAAAKKTPEATDTADLAKQEPVLKNMVNAWYNLGKMIQWAGSLMAVLGIKQAFQAVYGLTELGAAADSVRTSFNHMTEAMSVDSAGLLRNMRALSRGTISDMNLMVLANRSMLASSPQLVKDIPKLLEVARASALATGSSIEYVFQSLIKGIIRAQPRLIDNADIYIRIGAAVEDWAAKQGKLTNELTATERQQAIANAVISQGQAFIARMGLDSETTSEQMQKLPVAIKNLRRAVGELLVQAGATEPVNELAISINQLALALDISRQTKDLRDQLAELGESSNAFYPMVDALKPFIEVMDDSGASVQVLDALVEKFTGTTRASFESQQSLLKRLNEARVTATKEMDAVLAKTGSMAQASEAYYEALQEEISAINIEADALRRSKMTMGELWAEIARVQATTEGASSALEDFRNAAAQAKGAKSGVDVLTQSLLDLVASADLLSQGLPKMPSLGATALASDTSAIRQYLNSMMALRPNMAVMITETLKYVDALDQQRINTLLDVQAMDAGHEALQALATATFGIGASTQDLIDRFQELSPAVQDAAVKLGLLEEGVANLRAKANAPITIDIELEGLESSLDKIDSLALQLTGILNIDQIRQFRDQARAELEQHWATMARTDKFGQDLLLATELEGLQKRVDALKQANLDSEAEAKRHVASMESLANDMQSQIEAALTAGLEVTPLDMLETEMGTYQDKPLESARQLNAIMKRGFAELTAHPDWAALLKIPPEVLSGSEDVLKQWAGQTRQDVLDFTRADLVNWPAFIKQFEDNQRRIEAKKLTLDIALSKLDAAGALKGLDRAKVRKDLEAQMGLAAPTVTFESYFETQPEALDQLIADLLNGQDAAEIPAKIVPLPLSEEDKVALGMNAARVEVQPMTPSELAGVGMPTTQISPLSPADMARLQGQSWNFTPTITAPTTSLEQSGKDLAGSLQTSFTAAVKAQDVGVDVAQSWQGSFSDAEPLFKAIGAQSGRLMLGAMTQAMEDGAGDILGKMATLLAPSVADRLRMTSGTGALP